MLLHLDIKEPGLEADIAKLLDAADAWDHVVHVNPNAGNSEKLEKLRADPRVKPFHYKGWLNEAGDREEAMKKFLVKPPPMIFIGGDPAPAVKVPGGKAGEAALPEGPRAERGPKGAVRKTP